MRGGKREGAGRKSAVEEEAASDDYARLIKAKADREEANATRDLLKAQQEAGELYDRADVLQKSVTAIAIFAEQMRSLPDVLERNAGLSPAQAEKAEDFINIQLEDIKLKLMQVFGD